jgi:hypothetical protein
LKTKFTLDYVSHLHLKCHVDNEEHSEPIDKLPTPSLPRLQQVHIYFDDQPCLIQLLSAARPLLATLDPLIFLFFSTTMTEFVDIPATLWTSISRGWFRLKVIGYRRCILRVEKEWEEPKMVPWEVKQASGDVRGGFELYRPEVLKTVEAHFGEDTFLGALEADMGVFSCDPPPKPGSVCIQVPSLKDKERYDRAKDELEENHQEMVKVLVG